MHDGSGPLEFSKLTETKERFLRLRCELLDLTVCNVKRSMVRKKAKFRVSLAKSSTWAYRREKFAKRYFWTRPAAKRPAGDSCHGCGTSRKKLEEDSDDGELLCGTCQAYKNEDKWYEAHDGGYPVTCFVPGARGDDLEPFYVSD